MAITSNTYTGNGSNKLFSITFPYLETTDVDVYLNNVLQTITTQYTFANATTIEFVAAPGNGAVVLLDRSTDDAALQATFFPGSSIKAADLNADFDQTLYVVQEINNKAVKLTDPLYGNKTYIDAQDATKVNKSGDTMSGNLAMSGNKITGLSTPTASTDAATRGYVDGVALAGTVPDGNRGDITVSGTGTVWSIDAGAIVNADVNASAGIVATKLAFTQAGTGAVARTIDSKLKDTVSVKDFGAVGDGVADDTAAFTAALNAARKVLVPWGNYRLTSTITLNQVGHALVSTARTASLIGDHTNGPVITITARQCCLQDLIITSSNTRQAYTTGATYDLAAGLHGVRVYNTSASTTQCLFDGVIVQRQPSHGWYSGTTGTGTVYRQCQALGNRGHGFLFDDRTELGGTSSRGGICDLLSCVTIDNGGNAVNLSQNGSTCYRFRLINLESFNNAWNTSIPSLENSEVYIKGENHLLETCAVSDQLGGIKTTASTGDARLAKASLGRGIFVGTSSNNIFLINSRFISVDRGVVTGTLLGYLFINGAYFTQRNLSGTSSNVPVGFQIGSGCLKPVVQVNDDSVVTTMVTSDSLVAPPLVAKKLLSSSYSIPSTAAFNTITGMEETVFLGTGTYRFTCAATVQNGSTAGASFSLGILLTDSLSGTSRPPHGFYKSFAASYYDTLSLDFIYTITTSDTYTIALQVRQANGTLGTVLSTNNTFGNTAFFVERL